MWVLPQICSSKTCIYKARSPNDGKYSHDFDGARTKLDTLSIQIQKRVQLESKSSKTLKDLIESLHIGEGK